MAEEVKAAVTGSTAPLQVISMAHKKFGILEVLLPDDDVFSGHIPHIQQEYPCILTRNQANISALIKCMKNCCSCPSYGIYNVNQP